MGNRIRMQIRPEHVDEAMQIQEICGLRTVGDAVNLVFSLYRQHFLQCVSADPPTELCGSLGRRELPYKPTYAPSPASQVQSIAKDQTLASQVGEASTEPAPAKNPQSDLRSFMSTLAKST